MNLTIPFWKMHGAGNDFILVDDRRGTFPAADRAWMAAVGARRTGVGCDGIILIQPSTSADFRMRFFNPDGGEADMCGNAARCVARLAHEIGAAPADMGIETAAGALRATVLGDGRVRLRMTDPRDWRMGRTLRMEGGPLEYGFVNTGVPHAVVEVGDLAAVDVARLGAAVRHHRDFQPAGTNANFVHVEADGVVRVRTYERGVEGETLACGTGMVASALVAAKLGRVRLPALVRPASGDTLEVGGRAHGDGFRDVTLTGPAVHVYRGELDYRR
jgi:diaminopimelate epimerase